MSTTEASTRRDALAAKIQQHAEHLGFLRGMMEAARILRMSGDRAAAERLIEKAQA